MERRFSDNLDQILSTMDLPRQRIVPANLTNVRWLIRNIGIRNKSHPGFGVALKILETELKSLEMEST